MVSTIADSERDAQLPQSVRAEAAVWVARLHSDVRTELTEAGFRRWLAADPTHRRAFERMTNTWEATTNLRRTPGLDDSRSREFRSAFRRGAAASLATLAVCVLLAASAAYLLRSDGRLRSEVYATALGERRSLVLADGSHLVLNTNTRVRVALGSRLITLDSGQALFEVAHNPNHPFVVRAGGQQVVAVGTTFDVRWTDAQLSVVLLQGRVVVVPEGERPAATAAGAVGLEPGERLQFQEHQVAIKSAARLDREEAWVKGRVIFDSTPLSAAIAEINRYATRRIELADPSLGDLRISGTFSADDSGAFARALAQMFSLELSSSPGALVLAR